MMTQGVMPKVLVLTRDSDLWIWDFAGKSVTMTLTTLSF